MAELLKFQTDEDLEDLYRKTAWHFEEKNKKQSSSYDVFKQAVKYVFFSFPHNTTLFLIGTYANPSILFNGRFLIKKIKIINL